MKRTRVILLLPLLTILVSSCAVGRYKGTPNNPVQKEGYTLTFNDEFNAQRVDESKWITRLYWMADTVPYTSFKGETPKDYFDNDKITFTDTTVRLWVDRDTVAAGDWDIPFRSSTLDCHRSFDQKYGYFEIKCKMPQHPGYWPAFWLISTDAWPPEIDIFEIYTSRRKPYTFTHHYKEDDRHRQKGMKRRLPNSEGFNVYACEWDEEEVRYYFNNKQVGTIKHGIGNESGLIGSLAMHVIINNAAEDFNSDKTKVDKAQFPGYLEVDYVRVYQNNERLQ